MTHPPPMHRLDLLLLARLATAGKRPLAPSRIEADLFPFVEARLARREWSSQCEARLRSLVELGYVDDRRAPTPTGLERLRQALGVEALPSKWAEVWQVLVPTLALGLPGAQWRELAGADKLRARLIREHHGLPLPAAPTLPQAVDAQAWQELGLDRADKLGETAVKLALVEQALGVPVRTVTEALNAYCWTLLGEPPDVELSVGKLRRVLLQRTQGAPVRATKLDARKVGERLATAAAGTTTGEIGVIRRALVGRWIFADTAGPPSATTASTEASAAAAPEPAEPPSLPRWAEQVQAVAEATQSGRYGDERVFIAAVWRAAQAGPAALRASLPEFKARLCEANRAGLLRLHRADLVGAMDRELVRESETQHLNATFHFIEIPARRTA